MSTNFSSEDFSFKDFFASMPTPVYYRKYEPSEHFQIYDVISSFFADKNTVWEILEIDTAVLILFTKNGYQVFYGGDDYNVKELAKTGVCVWIPWLGDNDVIETIVYFLERTLIAFNDYSKLRSFGLLD
jgi:hypothetical protein